MLTNFKHLNADTALPNILEELLRHGEEVGSRGGSRTMELIAVGTTLTKPWQRELLHPLRKANIAAQIAETMWVLSGRNDVEFLSHYLPRAEQFSDDGEVWRGGYGPRLRNWGPPTKPGDILSLTALLKEVDQLAEVVRLLTEDRGTRRAVMSIFDPASDYRDSKDIPCNNWISFISRSGQLHMHVAIRSNDVMWGWSGINQFEWSALQEIVAGLIGVEVGPLHFSTTSLHLYDRHWEKANQIAASAVNVTSHLEDSPRFDMRTLKPSIENLNEIMDIWFAVENHIRTGDAPQVEIDRMIDSFPEPMMKSWLLVLGWWWTGDPMYLTPLAGTRLYAATQVGVQPKRDSLGDAMAKVLRPEPTTSAFLSKVFDLHAEKHAAYGDSWKRRGEMLGILANIARKVDRLEGGETSDETSADTAIDLMVYLAKYRAWIHDAETTDTVDSTHWWLDQTEQRIVRDKGQPRESDGKEEEFLIKMFDQLEDRVKRGMTRSALVEDMLAVAYSLASKRAKDAWHAGNSTRSWNPEAPHSRGCGLLRHDHGTACHPDCPSCGGES